MELNLVEIETIEMTADDTSSTSFSCTIDHSPAA